MSIGDVDIILGTRARTHNIIGDLAIFWAAGLQCFDLTKPHTSLRACLIFGGRWWLLVRNCSFLEVKFKRPGGAYRFVHFAPQTSTIFNDPITSKWKTIVNDPVTSKSKCRPLLRKRRRRRQSKKKHKQAAAVEGDTKLGQSLSAKAQTSRGPKHDLLK